ncbi:hydrolase [Mesorhizobium sp. SARCC-RB16n]|uniref:amidohydrolase family protein n=1 Tax=Mesorhizobium sp. SARCC-RB16n TaxID=2116687 RepID=UPI00122F792F|nr:amidohydrolase family protein [Mesorhizobium sp. SARCC-RB16n]KAA3445834.1 hydrolase [Mesorhizobium sp. SARCC-RB16n]
MDTNVLSQKPKVAASSHTGFIDCDIHATWNSLADLDEFLPQYWREHRETIGSRWRQGLAKTMNYPRMSKGGGVRQDAWPSNGSVPGADLPMMQKQLLDLFNVEYGIMVQPMELSSERNVEFGAALATAANEWQLARWCDPEPRLKGAVQINVEDEKAAIAEIERRAGDRRFVQVQFPQRGVEPIGRRRYWPIMEACAANGFPIAIHIGGIGGYPSTAGGWPSYYHEEHPAYVQAMQNTVISLVCEGVLSHIPNLKVNLLESGFGWLPSLCWRLDTAWKRLRAEVPLLRQKPSEYVRERIWLTTQPVDEPERPQDLLSTIEWIGEDRLMFSTDYPHWDQDDPRYAFKAALPEAWKRKIFHDNARTLYGLSQS